MFSTIKSKLTILAVISMLSYIVLAFFVFTNNSHANKALDRMVLLGDIREHTSGAMMELRGYQLLHSKDYLERYSERVGSLKKAINTLAPITRSKDNQEKIKELKALIGEWEEGNAPRFLILEKYGKGIHSAEFEASDDGKKLAELTKLSADRYKVITQKQRDLIKTMQARNIETLQDNAFTMDIVMALSAVIMLVLFVITVKTIISSILSFKNSIEKVHRDNDFTVVLSSNGKDEFLK